MNIIEDEATVWYGSEDSARFVPEGVEYRNEAGLCCECGQHHEGYEPDDISPCGQYHSERCPNG